MLGIYIMYYALDVSLLKLIVLNADDLYMIITAN